jgi:hypothetical protein
VPPVLVNDASCSVEGPAISESTRFDEAGTVSHYGYFVILEHEWGPDFGVGLERCNSAALDDCVITSISFTSSGGPNSPATQAGIYSGLTCQISRRVQQASFTEVGNLRIVLQWWEKSLPDEEYSDDGACSLKAAEKLGGDEDCKLYEVIVGQVL